MSEDKVWYEESKHRSNLFILICSKIGFLNPIVELRLSKLVPINHEIFAC